MSKLWLPSNRISLILRDKRDLIIVAVFSIAIGVIRLPYLDYLSFWFDEAIQVLAAEGILTNRYPFLPSGRLYWRGSLNSYLMAFSFLTFGVNEFSARIGSLIFSTLTLPLIYLFGKALGNKRVAALATIIMAFSPWVVGWARLARMYAQFQFFYLLTLYLMYIVYFSRNRLQHPRKHQILLIISFVGAALSHEVTVALIFGLLVYLLAARGTGRIKYRYIVMSAVALGVLSLVIFMEFGWKVPVIQFQPSWILKDISSAYKFFFKRYPLLSFLVAIGSLSLLKRKNENMVYLYSSFLVPLNLAPIANVLVLRGSIGERHVFFLLPIFVLISSLVLLQQLRQILDIVIEKIYKIQNNLKRRKIKKTIVWTILAIIVFPEISNLYAYIIIPNSNVSPTEAFSYYFLGHASPTTDIENWPDYAGDFRGACEFVEQRFQGGDVIISTQQVSVYYYLQGFIIEKNVSLFVLRGAGDAQPTRDFYLGSIMLNNLDKLQNVLYRNERAWIIADGHFRESFARDFILENTELVYRNPEDYIEVYLWS